MPRNSLYARGIGIGTQSASVRDRAIASKEFRALWKNLLVDVMSLCCSISYLDALVLVVHSCSNTTKRTTKI